MASDRFLSIRVQSEDFDIGDEIRRLSGGRKDIGAVVTFSGICRDEAGRLTELELEHYPGMAEAEIGRIADQAMERWPISGLTVIHRYGRLEPGDNIVLVLTASPHREAAFQAAEFLMDYLKTNAPFWKTEKRLSGAKDVWVEAHSDDDAAASRWERE